MDASCEIQGSIHVCLIHLSMCPGNWVHIKFHLIGRLFILREYHLFIIQAYGASILLLYYMGILTHDIHAAILVVTTPEKFPTR